MRANVVKMAMVFVGLAGAVYAADLFMSSPGNPTAAQGVMMVGVAIIVFTLALSLGGLVAGLWRGIQQWREAPSAGRTRHGRA